MLVIFRLVNLSYVGTERLTVAKCVVKQSFGSVITEYRLTSIFGIVMGVYFWFFTIYVTRF